VILGLLLVGGSSISKNVVDWVHQQQVYQLAFNEIELKPEPPKWIKFGKAGFLEQVRAGNPKVVKFSMAKVDLDLLCSEFAKNPWVIKVDRAEKSYPNHVSIALTYREPVATLTTKKQTYILDHEGVVLKDADLDSDAAGKLISIQAAEPRDEPKAGLTWPGDGDVSKVADLDPSFRVVMASKLAGFLKAKLVSDNVVKSESFDIYATQATSLYVLVDKKWVLWTRWKEQQTSTGPTDEQKWERLLKVLKSPEGLKLPPRGWLEFTDEGTIIKVPKAETDR
jgi:hypothetical protein